MSIRNQQYILDDVGECSVTLADGLGYTFSEQPVKLYCAKSADDVSGMYKYKDGQRFVLSGPPDDKGLWHILVLGIGDYGQAPMVIAQLTPEEADDMRIKIKAATDAYLDD